MEANRGSRAGVVVNREAGRAEEAEREALDMLDTRITYSARTARLLSMQLDVVVDD